MIVGEKCSHLGRGRGLQVAFGWTRGGMAAEDARRWRRGDTIETGECGGGLGRAGSGK